MERCEVDGGAIRDREKLSDSLAPDAEVFVMQALSAGLPQPPAYDLVYRHALEVDPTGRQLLTGSTTGSLWISEDQGDTWTSISSHLPPVYRVRFA